MRAPLLQRALGGALLTGALLSTALPGTAVASPPSGTAPAQELYLVALDGPGTAGIPRSADPEADRARLLARQDAVLTLVGAGAPVYRWTTALNGFAVRLDATQATLLTLAPGVARVEENTVRPLAGRPSSTPAASASPASAPGTGGAGRVVGVIDTGIAADGPVFAATQTLGDLDPDFTGSCPDAERWQADDCNDKVVSARHWVAGFGPENRRSGTLLSPYDDHGHGTEVASLAAGNAAVAARDGNESLGTFSGVAPDARLAIYKACWTAPDPADDGCATADVVSAIDQAVADGVDVLSVAVAGGPALDTVDLALLGAAERDVFVAVPAGNDQATAGHAQPWTTTVGAATGPDPTGLLRLGDGTEVRGVMTAGRGVPAARVVDAADVPARGHTAADAALCVPGALDAARVAGRIVVCDRGEVARVDKSAAVRLADGVGMVLVDSGPEVSADLHAVPTLHVTGSAGRVVRRSLAAPGPLEASLSRVATPHDRPSLASWTPPGDPLSSTVKPDLVAPGSGLLAATPVSTDGRRWDLLSGSSAATAVVSGLAARLRSEQPLWSAARIRSALMTSAGDIEDPDGLRAGAGLLRATQASRPGLVHDVDPAAYRRVLEDGLPVSRLNLPSVAVRRQGFGAVVVTRTVTNIGDEHLYFSSSATGFDRSVVTVTPAAIRIGPGETRTYRVTVRPGFGLRPQPDSGWVTWLGGDGTRVRIPLLVSPAP